MAVATRTSSPPPATGSICGPWSLPDATRAASRSADARDQPCGSDGDTMSMTEFTSGWLSAPRTTRYTCTMPIRLPATSGVTVSRTRDVDGAKVDAAQRARQAGGLIGHEPLPFLVVVGGDAVGARKNLLHRRVEPAIHRREDDAASDDEHEDGGNDGHSQE